ncbi:membrane protein FxsA [Aggregatibacter aphrophilus]|uniref:FxsA family protein n=1 Tax=Aggregatibacter aphrophilus TaxID=732 RepID=UPI0009F2694E|nr:FxsA family protein [Aggregatibacter aphrophilus]PNL92784.1 membrane protein FxsA [Aggregatibacter aphrophilus]
MPFIIFIFAAFLFIYVELSLLVWVGSQLGIIMLILLLIGSSMLGIVLIRARGWFMLTNTRKQLAQGEIPTETLFKSSTWFIAGVLFVIPGFVTDILACILLSPLGSQLLKRFFSNKIMLFRQNMFKTDRTFYNQHSYHDKDEDIIDAEFEKEVDEHKRLK